MKRRRLSRTELLTRNPVWRSLKPSPMQQSAQVDLQLDAYSALDEIMFGRGMHEHLDSLACATNLALLLCERGAGRERLEDVTAAQLGITRARHRADQGKAIALDGPAVQPLRAALELLGQQMAIVAQGDITDALNEVMRRISTGHVLQATA